MNLRLPRIGSDVHCVIRGWNGGGGALAAHSLLHHRMHRAALRPSANPNALTLHRTNACFVQMSRVLRKPGNPR